MPLNLFRLTLVLLALLSTSPTLRAKGKAIAEETPLEDLVSGTDENDELLGTKGDDSIDGKDGHHKVEGDTGNDELTGGDDNDLVVGDRVGDEWSLVDGKWSMTLQK